MKRIIVVLSICMLLLPLFQTNVLYAADTTKVSAAYEAIEDFGDGKYIIPVYIINNPGIMGLKINVSYDSSRILLYSIARGKVTAEGNFNTNINVESSGGDISVLWNDTEDIKGDGTLMYLCIGLQDTSIDTIDIELTYSQEDTFNEAWEDVLLECCDINYSLGMGKKTDNNPSTGKTEETMDKTEAVVDTEYDKYAEETVPSDLISEETEKKYLEQAKQEFYSTTVIEEIDENKIKDAMARKLKEYDISSADELPDDQKEQFWIAVKEDLVNIEGISREKLDYIDISSIERTVNVEKEDIENADLSVKPKEEKKVEKTDYVFIGLVAVVILFLMSMFVLIKRRKRLHD